MYLSCASLRLSVETRRMIKKEKGAKRSTKNSVYVGEREWWNVDGIVHFELVPDGRAVNGKLYSEQLERVYNILKQRYPTLIRRKDVLLQHDNAGVHRCNLTNETLDELGDVEILPHPVYSPDLVPSGYGLFRSMQQFLRQRRF